MTTQDALSERIANHPAYKGIHRIAAMYVRRMNKWPGEADTEIAEFTPERLLFYRVYGYKCSTNRNLARYQSQIIRDLRISLITFHFGPPMIDYGNTPQEATK